MRGHVSHERLVELWEAAVRAETARLAHAEHFRDLNEDRSARAMLKYLEEHPPRP